MGSRRWLQIPVSRNISHLYLPRSKPRLKFKTLKQIYKECKVSNQKILNVHLMLEPKDYMN